MATIGNYNIVISQENYKAGSANGIMAEQLHELDNAREKNYRDDLKDRNITLEHDPKIDESKNYREYFNNFIKENDVGGRMRLDDGKRATNVITSCVIGLSKEAYQSMTEQERQDYFKDGLEYYKECYPDYHIIDATIHKDEGYRDQETNKWEKGLDHLQIAAIPLYYNPEKERLEVSTTKAEKDHLTREMQKDGRDTSHIDLREQRQYLHDRFVEYNRDRGRDMDYKQREGHQNRLSVKMYKKVQDIEKSLKNKEKTLDRREEKVNQVRENTREVLYKIQEKERQLTTREQEIDKQETKTQGLRNYFNIRDNYLKSIDCTPYAYEKAVRDYERTGEPTFNYYSSADQKDYNAFVLPEVANPERQEKERQDLEREYKNYTEDREVHVIGDREHLETPREQEPEHEREEPNKEYDRER